MAPKIKNNRLRFFPLILLAGIFITFGCESACRKKEQDEKEHAQLGAVAIVNGKEIAAAELDSLHERAVEQFVRTGRPMNDDLKKRMRSSILRKLIDDEVIKQKAHDEGVDVDRFERVEALNEYKDRMGGEKPFKMFLDREKLSEDQIIKSLISDLRRDKLLNKLGNVVAPTEQEIQQHYQANQQLYSVPEMVRARHILLKLGKDEPQEKEQLVLKKAQQIMKEASMPNASFTDLVQKYSEGPSVKQGGDLGFFPRGRMVKSFEDAAFNAPLKEPVGPIKTDFGYHIIYVEEKALKKAAPLEKVRDRIAEIIKHDKRSVKGEAILGDLREDATIKISDYSMTDEEYKKLSQNQPLNNAPQPN